MPNHELTHAKPLSRAAKIIGFHDLLMPSLADFECSMLNWLAARCGQREIILLKKRGGHWGFSWSGGYEFDELRHVALAKAIVSVQKQQEKENAPRT